MTDNDHAVGYRRPPAHGRFKKGHSGNPKGRPKGKKNFLTELNEELRRLVTVQEGGREKKLSKQSVIIKSLIRKAAEGHDRAIMVLANLAQKEPPDSRPPAAEALSASEQKLLRSYLKRRAKSLADGEDDAD